MSKTATSKKHVRAKAARRLQKVVPPGKARKSLAGSGPGGMDVAAFDAMTDAYVMTAALGDPDAQPSTPGQLARMRRVPAAKRIRFKLRLTQEEFSGRFGIPIGTLGDWEQGKVEPDAAARTLLRVIETAPKTVAKAVKNA